MISKTHSTFVITYILERIIMCAWMTICRDDKTDNEDNRLRKKGTIELSMGNNEPS